MKHKIIKISIILIVILLISVCLFYLLYLKPMLNTYNEVRTMEIKRININEINDGIYQGEFNYNKLNHKVEVIISNSRINKINVLICPDSKYTTRAKDVFTRIIDEQTLQVDVISGATTSSKAYLKAIQNALIAD